MRQTGILAASAAYALTHNFPLLSRVHALAKRLENGLEGIGANIISRAETCMVSLYYFLILKSVCIIYDVTDIL
jgi:threonine aldolase